MPPLIVKNPQSIKEFVGKEIGVSEWLQITQDRIARFADATEDRQWIHLDRDRARSESPFGTTIAHGFLTLSLISHFMKEVIAVESGVRLAVNYGLNRVRFTSPVPAGSNIRARVVLQGFKELPDSVEATYAVTIERGPSERPACVAECIVRYYP